MIFQGQAFYNDFKDGMTFDTVGTEALKSIVPFENEKQGSPVVVRILSDGVSPIGPTRGDITWLYASKMPYLIINMDMLAIVSLDMLKPRSKMIEYYVKPGFCPKQALPDATLSMDEDMGKISDGIKQLINMSKASNIVYRHNEFSGSPYFYDYVAEAYSITTATDMTYELYDIYLSRAARTTSYVLYLSIVLGILLGHLIGYILFRMFQQLEIVLELYLFERRKLNKLKLVNNKLKLADKKKQTEQEKDDDSKGGSKKTSVTRLAKQKPRRINL